MVTRRVLAGTTLSLTLLVAALASPQNVPANAPANSRKPAADFTLSDSKGAAVRLSDYKGKVVLLNFWATWCHGCQLEIPWFIQFQDKYKDSGLAVIGVSMDEDGWKAINPWLQEKKVNYAIVIGNEGVGKQFGLGAMPMTLLIDREGKIAAAYNGVVNKAACEREIRLLLQENPSRTVQ